MKSQKNQKAIAHFTINKFLMDNGLDNKSKAEVFTNHLEETFQPHKSEEKYVLITNMYREEINIQLITPKRFNKKLKISILKKHLDTSHH